MEGMLARELAALECTLQHFEELGQQGLLITVNDRPVAFSIYEAISPTTVAVHFERALRSYKGLFRSSIGKRQKSLQLKDLNS